MKKLILLLSIVSLISCKEEPKKTEENIEQNEPTSQQPIETESINQNYGNQIIPGKRLGAIILNENATAVLDSLGKPDSGDAAMGKAVSTWYEGSKNLLSIYTTTKMGVEDFSRIKAIRSLSPDFKTEQGFGVNSTLSEIGKNFKLNKIGVFLFEGKNYTLFSSDEGISFEVGEDQKCHGIVITEKGTSPAQFYLTFYPGLVKQ
ncbi:hypothetical protein [Aequorivita capsosiphonis]|uniref:hypothetical protein n=1 Tax=Aequorivita capsosiphonis TaxID=487317 RepID=UPI0004294DF8|nr:hypothetical protein [Aequorivita capsosiphonis]